MKSKYSALVLLTAIMAVATAMTFQSPKATAKSQKTTKAGNDTITTKSGLKYIITKKNPKGAKAAAGDKIDAHYTGTLLNGKKFDSSRDRNQPFSFTLGQGQVIQGWDEGFTYLREGEKAILIIPSGMAYGERDMGDIPANSTLIFDVELVKVRKAIPYKPYSGKGKDTVKTASGLKYIVIAKGDKTKKATPGMMADMYYAGYLMNGTKFDANFGTFEPLKLPVTGAGVIKGWQEMIPLMNKGMKVRAIIPPHLAYGEKGYPGVIPGNATLIFDMMMSDLYTK